jgi:choline dehydrogenase-like flavoprotein
MQLDGRTIDAGTALTADLCIIGGGPAGISLALALAGQPIDILLIESGGIEYDADAQALSHAEGNDLPYEIADMRLRMLGGSTNHWAGYCRPLDPETFERRAWIPHSGWPISRADLDPFYPKAAELCEIGSIELDPALWAGRRGLDHLDLTGRSTLTDAVFQLSPFTRFGDAYLAELEAAGNIRLCLNTTIARLTPTENGRTISSAEAVTFAGNGFTIEARTFVVACGGVENARLLLASNDVVAPGIGNQHDQLGRYFMDHGHFHLGHLVTNPPFDRRIYEESYPTDTERGVTTHLKLDHDAQAEAGIGNQALQLRERVMSESEHSFWVLKRSLLRGLYPDRLWHHVGNLLSEPGPVLDLVGRRLFSGDPEPENDPRIVALRCVGEQIPNPDSRVSLTEEKDRFDVPIAHVEWQMSELDWVTMQRTGEIVGQEFGRLGLGRYRPADEDEIRFIDGGWHHMGTTRMSADPTEGVVDSACRVHGMGNLFIAGSSVFSTGGHGAPTLSIVALALRLADHLKAKVFA